MVLSSEQKNRDDALAEKLTQEAADNRALARAYANDARSQFRDF